MSNLHTTTEPEREQLRALFEAHAEREASRRLDVDRLTLLRAIAGLPMQRRTIEHLRRKLAEQTAGAAA